MEKLTTIALCALVLSGCASFASVRVEKESTENHPGLAYYMPEKDFVVTFTVADGGGTTIAFSASSAYPDLSHRYYLQHTPGGLSTDLMDFNITQSGLLNSTGQSIYTSQVGAILSAAAGAVGGVEGLGILGSRTPPAPKSDCTMAGIYVVVLKVGKSTSECGYLLTATQYATAAPAQGFVPQQRSEAGVYYRQEIPYLVAAVPEPGKPGLRREEILFSPSGSATHFLPVTKGFFANAAVDFTFVDGVPTKYKQSKDSEVLSFAQIPSAVLTAYFQAIGSAFTLRNTNATNETNLLNQTLLLELMRTKVLACRAALHAKDEKQLAALNCGS